MGRRTEDVEITHEIRLELAKLRARKGLTQRALAEALSVTQSHMCQLENGLYAPGWAQLARWVRALDAHLVVHVANGIITVRSLEEAP